MKVAIYSRGGQTVQPSDLLNLNDALGKAHITPVFFKELHVQFQEAVAELSHYETFTNAS